MSSESSNDVSSAPGTHGTGPAFPGPAFLGIGAPRSGTTWLHAILSRHPDLWLPPIKELHYFDSIDPTLDEGFRTHRRGYRWLRHGGDRLTHYLAYPISPFVRRLRGRVKPVPGFDARYFFGDGSLDWYCSLFETGRRAGKLPGEITPAYSMLSTETIRRVHALNPDMKLIMILRNPMDRVWSNMARWMRDSNRGMDQVAREELIRRVRSGPNMRRSAYLENIGRWQEVFGESALFIGYFDDLRTQPRQMINRVCAFLGVRDISADLPKQAIEPVNVAGKRLGGMPEWMAIELARLYEPQLRDLSAKVGHPATAWHRQAMEVLEGAGSRD
jgi:hypothetical protein